MALLDFPDMHIERIATGRLKTVVVSREILIVGGPNIGGGWLEAETPKGRQKQLFDSPSVTKRGRRDSNAQPSDRQSDALTNWATAP